MPPAKPYACICKLSPPATNQEAEIWLEARTAQRAAAADEAEGKNPPVASARLLYHGNRKRNQAHGKMTTGFRAAQCRGPRLWTDAVGKDGDLAGMKNPELHPLTAQFTDTSQQQPLIP